MAQTFRTTLRQEGKTATGFEVPPEVVEALGGGKRPPVTITINGYTYRSTVSPYTEAYMLPLAAEHRSAAGVEAGQQMEVTLELDTAPRVLEIPPELAAALDADPQAKAFFDGLSYSNKRRIVEPILDIKSAETRARRIDKTVAKLHDHTI